MGESMSKERELLKEVMSHFAAGEVAVSNASLGDLAETLYEIQGLLAQPEQEQEPMAWMWTRNYEGGGYTNRVFQMRCEADEYAKDSESLKRPDLVRPLYLGVDK